MQTQFYLRHALAETISEGIINCLIITNSSEANIQLTRLHEHIFARKPSLGCFFKEAKTLTSSVSLGDPTVASVWRRQTFSAAVQSCTPEMSLSIMEEHLPALTECLEGTLPMSGGISVLEAAYDFSRMLHGSNSGPGDAFYRAFVPELGSTLHPSQVELVKRCILNEGGGVDKVGATIFPGLVKVSRGPLQASGRRGDDVQVIYCLSFLKSTTPLNHFLDRGAKGPSSVRVCAGWNTSSNAPEWCLRILTYFIFKMENIAYGTYISFLTKYVEQSIKVR